LYQPWNAGEGVLHRHRGYLEGTAMKHCCLAFAVLLLVAAIGTSAEPIPYYVLGHQGKVEKVEKDTLTLAAEDGSGKSLNITLELKLTPDTKITTAVREWKGNKFVISEKTIKAKDLHPDQMVAVIYGKVKGDQVKGEERVVLSAVVLAEKESAK